MLKQAIFLLVISIFSLTAQSATNLRSDSYFIEYSSGSIKYQPYKKHLLIHSDVSIPLEYSDSSAFQVHQTPANNGNWSQPNALTDSGYLYGKSGSWSGISLEEADFNGDGKTDLLARTSLTNARAFIIYGSVNDAPDRIDYLSGTEISSNTTISDYDGDGKDEIAVSTNGQIHTVYDVSGSSGNLILAKNTEIDYRQFVLGGYIGYLPKAVASHLISNNKLRSSVDPGTGSLTLNLPIDIPSGDVEAPNLGIAYYGSGVDSLGYGWKLVGESAIEECLAKGVSSEINKLTTFCKDGRELVEVRKNYIFSQSEYKYKDASPGELSRFSLVNSNEHPNFLEIAGDGTVISYGLSSKGGGLGNKYKITSVQQKNGSIINYYYNQKGVLSEILYGAMRIKFEYSDKGVSNEYGFYLGNDDQYNLFTEEKSFLTKIIIKEDQDDISRYYLGYNTQGGVRLNNFQQCTVVEGREECADNYSFISSDAIEVTENNYDYELTEDQFKYATFYSEQDAWHESSYVSPKAIFAEVGEVLDDKDKPVEKFLVKKVDFGSNNLIQQAGSSQLYNIAGGTDLIKPLRPIYYRNKIEPYFFTPYPSFKGSCSIVYSATSSGSIRLSGPSGNSSFRFGHGSSSSGCTGLVPTVQLKAMNEGGGNANFVTPHLGDSMIMNVERAVYASGAIPMDINSDGINEVASAFIVSDDSNNTSLNLEVSIVGNRHPINNASNSSAFPIIRIPVTGRILDGQDYDFKVSPVVDFDGDLDPELIIRANGEYYRAEVIRNSFEIELRRIVFDNSAHKSLFDLDPMYLDINGDGITDVARIDNSGLKAYISKPALDYQPGNVNTGILYHVEELIQNTIQNAQFVDNEVSITNALTYDFNTDGKDDLLILKQGSTIAEVYLSNGKSFDFNGHLSRDINIKSSNINMVKISDYDRDGNAEFIEWMESSAGLGKIRVVESKSLLGKVAKAEYAGIDILDVVYEDINVSTSNENMILPPLSRKLGYENKVQTLISNRGAKGWVKEHMTYSGLEGSINARAVSFTTVNKNTSTASYSEGLPLLTSYDQIQASTFKFSFKGRGFYLDSVDEYFHSIDGESDTSFKAVTENYYYQEKEFLDSLDKSKYYINSEVEKRTSSSYPGTPYYFRWNNSTQYKVIDELGRIDHMVKVEDGLKTSIDYSYDTEYPSFITREETRRAILSDTVLNDSALVGDCATEDSADVCDLSVKLIEPYTHSNNYRTGMVGKVTQYQGDSQLESTTEYGYLEIVDDPYENKGGYLSTKKVTDSASKLERWLTYGQPQYGNPTTTQVGTMSATTYSYNPYGGVLTQVEPTGASVTNTYDGLGRIKTTSSNVGTSTSTSYQSCVSVPCPAGSYMYQETAADTGEKSRVYFDINGAETGSGKTNSNGEWLYSFNHYDIKGRIVKEITNAQAFSATVGKEFKYRTDNLISEIIEPKGAVDSGYSQKQTTFTYDFKTKSNLGNQTLAAKLDFVSDNLIKQTTINESYETFNVGGLAVPAKSKSTVVWNVAATDRLLAHDIDLTKSTATLYSYDVWGRNNKTHVIGHHATTSGGLNTSTTTQEYISQYDKAGNLVLSDRPGRNAITHAYNAFGELVKTTAADGSVIDLTYDEIGNIKSKSYSGIASSNIAARDYTWNYSPTTGLLNNIKDTTLASSPITIESYTYKAELPLIDIHTKSINGISYSKSYNYDVHGRIEDEIFNTGFGFKHGYLNGQLSSVSDLSGGSIWSLDTIDRQGRPTLKTYFGNFKYHQAFETHTNQLTSRYLKLGNDVLDGEELFFDPFDNLKLKVATAGAENTDNLSMNYDDKNRLSSVIDGNAIKTQERVFGFDDFGNFTHKDTANANYSYSLYGGEYNSWISSYKLASSQENQAINYSPSTTESEGAGHITQLAGFDLAYNEMGQPYSITNTSDYQVDFQYGPNDELVSVNYSDGRKINLWGNMQHVTVNATPGSQSEESYYRFRKNAAIILQGETGSQYNGRYIAHLDHLGSIRSIWNSAGANADASWVGSQTFDAYGSPLLSAESTNGLKMTDITDAGYTGQLMIKGTSFIHMNARLYDYGSGVFTSTDPLFADMQRAGGLNAYGYVYGNPFSFVDPDGTQGVVVQYEDEFRNWANELNIPVEIQAVTFASAVAIDDGLLAGVSVDNSWETNALQGLVAAIPIGRLGDRAYDLGKSGYEAYKQSKNILGHTKPSALNSHKIESIKQDMIDGNYNYAAPEGIISGTIDSSGILHVSDGQHRINAALEILEDTSDSTPLNNLINSGQNGYGGRPSIIQSDVRNGDVMPLPRRSGRNWWNNI